jgi:hypothetical protein
MRINYELIITTYVKTHFVRQMTLIVGVAVSQGAQNYGRIALKRSRCFKFLMIPEGYAVNEEENKGGKKVQMLRLCCRNLHIASSRNVANICTDAD